MTTCIKTVLVLGPIAAPASPDVIKAVSKVGRIDGARLVPSLIDALCREEERLSLLRGLDYLHYAGAPLGEDSGALLAPHVKISPAIGSTEASGYFTKIRETDDDWSYVEFQPHAGASFEPRMESLHEFVFVRQDRDSNYDQLIFLVHPNLDRYETRDLWTEHPTRKGLWKIVGRADDYVYLAHGGGLHASTLEPELERHALVQAALIGGHGRPTPMVLLELVPGPHDKLHTDREALVDSLRPYVDRVNAQCHPVVPISPDAIIFVREGKPLIRTMKGSVERTASLKLYEPEIEELFQARPGASR